MISEIGRKEPESLVSGGARRRAPLAQHVVHRVWFASASPAADVRSRRLRARDRAVRFGQTEFDALAEEHLPQIDQGSRRRRASTCGTLPMNRTINRGGDARWAISADSLIAHVVDVEVEDRPFGADHEHVGDPFVFRMTGQVREERRARNPSDLGHARTRRAYGGAAAARARRRTARRSRSPNPSTPSTATIATANSARLKRQMWRSASICTSPVTADDAIGRQNRLGQMSQQAGKEHHDDEGDERGDQPRQRRAGAARSR